jgi:hypothetical protein
VTPAETLTAAAQRLRERAIDAVHGGRTTWRRGNTLGTRTKVVLDDPDKPTVLIETYAERLERVNAYLELVGPATGLALADWLDDAAHRQRATEQAAARTWANSTDLAARDRWIAKMTDQKALAVARQILGEVTG